MYKFIQDHRWVEFNTLEEIYLLFFPHRGLLDNGTTTARTEDVVLEDGTVITKAIAEMKLYEIAVQKHLDKEAQAKGYDNILSACSYAGVANVFQAEAISFLEWRSACWDYAYGVFGAVRAGTQTAPTKEELITALPVRAIPPL